MIGATGKGTDLRIKHNKLSIIMLKLHLNHIKIESGKRKKDIYHIQHINSLHSRLKAFMSDFKDVATKHLQNYLYWFKLIEIFKSERESIKMERDYVLSQAHHTDCSVEAIKTRTPAFV